VCLTQELFAFARPMSNVEARGDWMEDPQLGTSQPIPQQSPSTLPVDQQPQGSFQSNPLARTPHTEEQNRNPGTAPGINHFANENILGGRSESHPINMGGPRGASTCRAYVTLLASTLISAIQHAFGQPLDHAVGSSVEYQHPTR
jgi:hypothetical protein